MRFRPAQPKDAPTLAEMWHTGWHQGHAAHVSEALVATRTRAEFDGRVRAHLGKATVAERDGVIAGFHMLKADELYQFYVGAEYRGTDVAALLMDHAENALIGRLAWLACAVGNARAARFYEKRGWERLGTFVYSVETSGGPMDVDEWRYQKDLR